MDPRWGSIGKSSGYGFQVSTRLNTALSREGFARVFYPRGCVDVLAGRENSANKPCLVSCGLPADWQGAEDFSLRFISRLIQPLTEKPKLLQCMDSDLPCCPGHYQSWAILQWCGDSCFAKQISLARSSLSVCTPLPSLPHSSWNLTKGDSFCFFLNWRNYHCMILCSWCSLPQWWLHLKALYPCGLSPSQK